MDYENSKITFDPKIDINGAEKLPISMEILPVITLEIADEKHKFILDTGANTCLLSTELIGKNRGVSLAGFIGNLYYSDDKGR